jgi:hypothetical protein
MRTLFHLLFFACSALLLVPTPSRSQTFMVKNYPLLGDSLVRGDFNNDGILDLVSPTYENVVINKRGDTVGVPYVAALLGTSEGTFRVPVRTRLPNGYDSATTGDFNQDGNLDLATLSLVSLPGIGAWMGGVCMMNCRYASEVMVLLGNGDGTFQLPRLKRLTTRIFGFALTVGDFDGDGNLDIAVGSGNPASGQTYPDTIYEPNTISIFPGDGRGNFGAPIKVLATGDRPLREIYVADFNGDGKQDIAVATEAEVIVLLGDGPFTFTPTPIASYHSVGDITPTDVNQDGFTDLLVSFQGCNGLCSAIDVFLSNGPNHTLQRSTTIPATSTTIHTAADLAPSSEADQTVRSRVASPYQAFPPGHPVAVDINGDGLEDIVATSRPLSTIRELDTWLAQPNSTYEDKPHRWILEAAGFEGLVPGDFNRDGKIDLATANVGYGTLVVLLNSTPKARCHVSTQYSAVTLCTPQDLAFTHSPVSIAAVSTPEPPIVGNPIVEGQIFVDNKLAYQTPGSQVDTSLVIAPGNHRIVAKFWDSAGASSQAVSRIAVFAGLPGRTCAPSPQEMTICGPAAGAVVSSPLRILASVMSDTTVTAVQVFIDGDRVSNDLQHDTYINATFPVSPGSHHILVQAYDAHGNLYKASRDVTVQ